MKTKEEKKLFELLALVQSVYIKNWEILRRLVGIMDYIEVVEKSWYDSFKRMYPELNPLNLHKLDTWSTYEGCVDLIFKEKEGKLICTAIIWDGDMLYGCRKQERFKAVLIIPDSFIKVLESNIMSEFNRYLSDQYAQHLENQRKDWINSLKNKILEA